jgi:hypothetical protein
MVSGALVCLHGFAPGLALCGYRVDIVHMLGCCGQIVRRSHLASLPVMRWTAFLLFLLIRVRPVSETAVSGFVANFVIELGVRVLHARKAFVFGSFRALKHNKLLVEGREHVGDEHAKAKEELARLDGCLLFGREVFWVLWEKLEA